MKCSICKEKKVTAGKLIPCANCMSEANAKKHI